jgi:hypothetical protein
MTARFLWLGLGCLSVALGAAGMVLPLLPTTPFLLLAAYAFARSSPRLHRWLLEHKRFGPVIENWRRYGAISRRTKIYSVAAMIAALAGSAAFKAAPAILIVQAVVLSLAGAFVVSRPAPPEDRAAD